MKLFSIEKLNHRKFTNLGSKIKRNKFEQLMGAGSTMLLQEIKGQLQMDFRIRKVVTDFKHNTFHYVFTTEFGQLGFDRDMPRPKTSIEHQKFGSFKQLVEHMDKIHSIKENDWLMN